MRNGLEAEEMAVEAMTARKEILGREHNDTLSSMAMASLGAYGTQEKN